MKMAKDSYTCISGIDRLWYLQQLYYKLWNQTEPQPDNAENILDG